jgi:hypothetical protein
MKEIIFLSARLFSEKQRKTIVIFGSIDIKLTGAEYFGTN